jgi:hypothetical protein
MTLTRDGPLFDLTNFYAEAVAFKTVQPLRSVHVDKGEHDLDACVKTSHTDGNSRSNINLTQNGITELSK